MSIPYDNVSWIICFHRDQSLGEDKRKNLGTLDRRVLLDWVEKIMIELMVQDQTGTFKLIHKEVALKTYGDAGREYLRNIMSALSNILQFDSALDRWFQDTKRVSYMWFTVLQREKSKYYPICIIQYNFKMEQFSISNHDNWRRSRKLVILYREQNTQTKVQGWTQLAHQQVVEEQFHQFLWFSQT